MVKNAPANAGDMGSILNPGRSHMPRSNYTHAPQLLGLCPRVWELQPLNVLEPLLRNRRRHCNAELVHHRCKATPGATPSQERAQQWRPSTAKNETLKISKRINTNPCQLSPKIRGRHTSKTHFMRAALPWYQNKDSVRKLQVKISDEQRCKSSLQNSNKAVIRRKFIALNIFINGNENLKTNESSSQK